MENAIIWWVINHSLNKAFRYISELASCTHHRVSLPFQACNFYLSWKKAFQAVLQAPKILCEPRQHGTCAEARQEGLLPILPVQKDYLKPGVDKCCFSTSNYNLNAIVCWDVYSRHTSLHWHLSPLSVAARVEQTCRLCCALEHLQEPHQPQAGHRDRAKAKSIGEQRTGLLKSGEGTGPSLCREEVRKGGAKV